MPPTLTNKFWTISIDPHTGAMTRVAHPDDVHGMNWVCSPTDNLWFPSSNGWGLGSCELPDMSGSAALRWQLPKRLTARGRRIQVV